MRFVHIFNDAVSAIAAAFIGFILLHANLGRVHDQEPMMFFMQFASLALWAPLAVFFSDKLSFALAKDFGRILPGGFFQGLTLALQAMFMTIAYVLVCNLSPNLEIHAQTLEVAVTGLFVTFVAHMVLIIVGGTLVGLEHRLLGIPLSKFWVD